MHINSALNTYFCGVKVRPVNLLPGTFAFLLLISPAGCVIQ